MQKNRRIALAATALTLTMAICAAAWPAQQEKKAAQTRSVATFSPEMERLKFYLGEWDYTETYPKGAVNAGVYTSRLGPGGMSMINTFHSHGPVGDFEGMLVITWDPNEKIYKEYVFNGVFPGAIVETGQFEGDDLVFRGEVSMAGTAVKLRNTTRVTGGGKLISEQFSSANGAPEKVFVHVEATKR